MKKSREVTWLMGVLALIAIGSRLHIPKLAPAGWSMMGIVLGDSREAVLTLLGTPCREFQERGPDEPWALKYPTLTVWLDRSGHVKRLAGYSVEKDGRRFERGTHGCRLQAFFDRSEGHLDDGTLVYEGGRVAVHIPDVYVALIVLEAPGVNRPQPHNGDPDLEPYACTASKARSVAPAPTFVTSRQHPGNIFELR